MSLVTQKKNLKFIYFDTLGSSFRKNLVGLKLTEMLVQLTDYIQIMEFFRGEFHEITVKK